MVEQSRDDLPDSRVIERCIDSAIGRPCSRDIRRQVGRAMKIDQCEAAGARLRDHLGRLGANVHPKYFLSAAVERVIDEFNPVCGFEERDSSTIVLTGSAMDKG
jgi:hypothetical protein